MNLAARITSTFFGLSEYRTILCLQCQNVVLAYVQISLDEAREAVVTHCGQFLPTHAQRHRSITLDDLVEFNAGAHGYHDSDTVILAFRGD